MRTLLIGAMATTMVACSCPPLPRQVSLQGCTDADGLTCLDGIAAIQPTEQAPASLNANVTTAKTRVAAQAEWRSSAHARDKAHAAADTAKPTKGKKASGEDTGDRPFLYLVKDDEAYVVDGPTGSAAATAAYHNICN